MKDITASKIQTLLNGMKETLKNTPDGVGLAAPQIGENLRIFIVSEEAEEIDRATKKGYTRRHTVSAEKIEERPYEKREWNYYVFINPVVQKTSRRMRKGAEGCLSVPGKFGVTRRHEKITLEAYDEHGNKFIRGASNFFAQVVQHELDHLEGILFIDKAELGT